MTQKSSILKNIFIYSSSSLTTLFLFALLVLSGKYLGAEDFGRLSFAMAFVFLFDPVLDPGLYHYLIKEISCAKDSVGKYLAHGLTWKFLASPLVCLIIFIVVNLIHSSSETIMAVYLMTISMLAKSIKDLFRTALLAHEYFALDSLSLFFERGLLLLFGATLLLSGKGLLALCWVFAILRIVDTSIVAIVVHYKICKISLGKDLRFVKNLIFTAVPIAAFYITLNIYNYIDTVMLSSMRNDIEVGWYNASYKIYEGMVIIPVTITTVFMPRLSQFYKENIQEFRNLMDNGLKYIVILAIIVSTNGILLSDMMITILYGEEYINSIPAMNILLVGLAFVFVINFLQTAMITMEKQKVILKIAILGLILNVAFNLILIPRHGYLGAAFVTIVVEFLICIISVVYVMKLEKCYGWLIPFGKSLLAASISFLGVMVFLKDHSDLLRVVLFNGVLIALILVLKTFNKKELETIPNLILRRIGFSKN